MEVFRKLNSFINLPFNFQLTIIFLLHLINN